VGVWIFPHRCRQLRGRNGRQRERTALDAGTDLGGGAYCRAKRTKISEKYETPELLDDRVGTRSTIVTSQVPVRAWHTYLNDPTLADAILDRVVHSSHKIELKVGKSMRDTDGAAKA
jgi:hypothetical protein